MMLGKCTDGRMVIESLGIEENGVFDTESSLLSGTYAPRSLIIRILISRSN